MWDDQCKGEFFQYTVLLVRDSPKLTKFKSGHKNLRRSLLEANF